VTSFVRRLRESTRLDVIMVFDMSPVVVVSASPSIVVNGVCLLLLMVTVAIGNGQQLQLTTEGIE